MREIIDAFRAARYAWDIVRFGSVKEAVTTIIPSWIVNQPQYNTLDYDTLARVGYGQNALIWACIREIATSASEAPLRVYERQESGDLVALNDHPLRTLIHQPNPSQTEFEFFEDLITVLEIYGNAYIEKERSRSGKVVALWPVRPDRMTVVPGSTGVSEYIYTIGEFEIPIKTSDIIHIKLPNPWNDYYGASPIATIANVGDTDNAAMAYLKSFFDNGAVPMGIFKTRQRIDRIEADRLKKRWKDKFQGNWHDIAIIDSEGEYQQVGIDISQLDLTNLNAITETRICSVFGVPPILVGAWSGLARSTYSNYSEARRHFWDETLVPLYVRLSQKLDTELLPEFVTQNTNRVYVAHDMSSVRALREDVNDVWRRAADALRAGGITINMFLGAVGLNKLGPEGDVFLLPANAVPIHANQLEFFMNNPDVLSRLAVDGSQPSVGTVKPKPLGDNPATKHISDEEFQAMLAARRQEVEAIISMNGYHEHG